MCNRQSGRESERARKKRATVRPDRASLFRRVTVRPARVSLFPRVKVKVKVMVMGAREKAGSTGRGGGAQCAAGRGAVVRKGHMDENYKWAERGGYGR
jgi:hypothetical protein